MQNSRSNEIKVGIVSLAAIAIAILGIGYVNNSGFTDDENKIQFLFDRTAGINNSAPIFVNGVERGKVTEVDNYKGKVKITGFLDKQDDLKKDATAEIMILEITGGKKIEIDPGKSDQPFTAEFIPGTSVSDLSELVSVVNDVSDDAINLIRRLDTISMAINRVIRDTSFVNNIVSTADDASELVSNANAFFIQNSGKLENLITNLKSISTKLEKAIDDNEPKIANILDELDIAIGDAKQLLGSADKTAEDIKAMISDINNIIDDIKTEKSIVNKLLYDEEFAQKLDSAFSDIGEFVRLIEKHGVNVNLRIGTRP